MKRSVIALAALLGVVSPFAFSADSPENTLIRIGISDSANNSVGLSFTLPAEPGWTRKGDGVSVTLTKDAGNPADNREIDAYLMRLDVPVSSLNRYIDNIRRNTEQGYAGSKKFTIKTLEVTPYPKNAQCAEVHLLLEGLAPSDGQQHQWSEQYVLSCGLLHYKSSGFELRYYHRYQDSTRDAQFSAEAAKVLDSVVIEEKVSP